MRRYALPIALGIASMLALFVGLVSLERDIEAGIEEQRAHELELARIAAGEQEER